MRKIVLISIVVISVIITCVGALPWFISIFGLDKHLTEYVENSLNDNGQQALALGRIRFNWTSVHLEEAHLIDRNEGSVISVKGIRFAYNPFRLAANLNHPINAVNEIYLIEPTVIIQQNENISETVETTVDSVVHNIQKIWQYFTEIDRIQLTRGKIMLKRESGKLFTIVSELDGWMQHADSSKLNIAVSGEIFNSSSEIIALNCQFNLAENDYHAEVSISQLKLSSLVDLKDLELPLIQSGILNSRLKVHSRALILDSLKVSGELTVQNANFVKDNRLFDKINLKCILNRNQLTIEEGSFTAEGSEFTITGKIENIYEPELKGTLSSRSFDPVPYLSLQESVPAGKSTFIVDCQFDLKPNSLMLNAGFKAASIDIGTQTVENFSSHLIYQDKLIRIKNITFSSLEFFVNGEGYIDLSDGGYRGHISASRNFDAQLLLDRMSHTTLDTEFHIQGNIHEISLDGYWDYILHAQADTILSLGGIVTLEEGNFKFRKTRCSKEGLTLQLEIADIFNNPRINYGYFENPPLETLTSRSWLEDFLNKHTIEGILSGPVNDLNFRFSIRNKKDSERQLSVTSRVLNLLDSERKIFGDIQFNGFSSSYDLLLGRSYLRGSVSSGEHLSGIIDLELARDEQINTRFVLDRFPVTQIFEDSLLGDAGEIDGEINIGGTLDQPRFTSTIQGDKFIINDIGYYKVSFKMSGIRDILKVDSLQIFLNNVPVLVGFFDLDLIADKMSAGLRGTKVDAAYVLQTIFADNRILSGSLDYNVRLEGAVQSPKINAQVTLYNGELDGIAFDQLNLSLKDSLVTGSSFLEYENHLIDVDKFEIKKGGYYHLYANGQFPIYNDGIIDLKVDFDGDFFSFIPHWDSFFVDGACFSSITMHVGGTPSKPRLISGKAQIDRGELWLKSVIKHIENISGSFEYNPKSKTVYMSNFHAEVDGQPLEIYTVDTVRTNDGKSLNPWYFKDLDLNFGILSMRTPRGGIKLEINGFMLPGEQGAIALSGKTANDNFYFAGPVQQPTAWGKIILSDTRFTFPFISESSGKPSLVVQFLQNMYWDVLVIPGEDAQFVRAIPAFIGEVDTELDLDVHSEGISFSGVINNNTFHAVGEIISTRGRLEYLDLNFRVDNFGVVFNRTAEKPEVYGKAWTTVRDSVGAIPRTINLELYAIDRSTGQVTTRSRWEDFRFRLITADPAIGETQEQVLAYLGYSVENIKEKATEVGGAVTENYVIRPLLRPLERRIERYLGFDLVRFNSSIAKNLFLVSLGQRTGTGRSQELPLFQDTFTPYALLLESSEFTLGKYLSRDLYLTYTGQIVTTANQEQNEFNLNHSLGLEYRFFKNLLLEFEYYREALNYYQIYSDKSYMEDFKIRLRHSFSF